MLCAGSCRKLFRLPPANFSLSPLYLIDFSALYKNFANTFACFLRLSEMICVRPFCKQFCSAAWFDSKKLDSKKLDCKKLGCKKLRGGRFPTSPII